MEWQKIGRDWYTLEVEDWVFSVQFEELRNKKRTLYDLQVYDSNAVVQTVSGIGLEIDSNQRVRKQKPSHKYAVSHFREFESYLTNTPGLPDNRGEILYSALKQLDLMVEVKP